MNDYLLNKVRNRNSAPAKWINDKSKTMKHETLNVNLQTKIYLAICFIFFIACTDKEIIDLKNTDDVKLVVFGEFTNEEKIQKVFLSTTSAYFSQAPAPVVSGAKLLVSDGFSEIELVENIIEPGTYQTPVIFKTVANRTYKLTIEQIDINKDGVFESYEAESHTRDVAFIDGVIIKYSDEWKCWDVGIFFTDPEESEDYYLFKLYKNNVLHTDTITEYKIFSDRTINGKEVSGIAVHSFDMDRGEFIYKGDMITLGTFSITRNYYDFINGLKQETSDRIPLFSSPPANLKGNISNGALGFFATATVTFNTLSYYE